MSAENILVSAANTLAEVKKENLKPNEFFHSVKVQTLEAYYKKLADSSLLVDLDAFFSQFKDDLIFLNSKVKGLLREDHYSLLSQVESYSPSAMTPSSRTPSRTWVSDSTTTSLLPS